MNTLEQLDKCDVIHEKFIYGLFNSWYIFPDNRMDKSSKLNACIRLVILLTIFMYLGNYSLTHYFLFFSLIIIFLYSYSSKENFEMSLASTVQNQMNSMLPFGDKPSAPYDFRTDNLPSQPVFAGDIKKQYEITMPRPHYGTSYNNDSIGIKSQQGIIGVNESMNDLGLPTFFSIKVGTNPKQNIAPIIIDRLTEDSVWDAPINVRGTINKRFVDDVTELELGINCTRSDGTVIPNCVGDDPSQNKVPYPYDNENECPIPPRYSLATPIRKTYNDLYTRPFNKPEPTNTKPELMKKN